MAHFRYSIVLFILIATLAGCDRQKNQLVATDGIHFRRVAWEFLSKQDQETVAIDWREAKIVSGVSWGNRQNLVSVFFPTTMDALLGPIIVYIDPETMQVLGIALRL